MRAFLILILFVLTFILFVSGFMRGANLTSNPPGSAGAYSVQAAAPEVAPQVITIQESPSAVTNPGSISVPVTGSCSDPYTIQPGDTLLQIAAICNTSLVNIRQANPQIADANLIYPGQQLHIPGAIAAVQPTLPVPVTGDQINQAGTSTNQQTLPSQAANEIQINPTPAALSSGLYATIPTGTGLQVKGIDFPPNTPVTIAVGPQGQGYSPVANGVTDASGNVTVHIEAPQAQNPQTLYVVVVATAGTPPVQAMSQPFFIGSAVP
jgi:LysM repeat protein